jgi:Exonuclease VII, large subunit
MPPRRRSPCTAARPAPRCRHPPCGSSAAGGGPSRRRDLDRLALALAAHDPQRTLERGYALVEDPRGAPVTSARAARGKARLSLRFHDGRVEAERITGGESVRDGTYRA